MEFVDEFRKSKYTKTALDEIKRTIIHSWTIMEICGGQTHAILQHGIDELLPSQIELVHGPGCPVCVTSLELIDKSHLIASLPEVIFTSFGDMLRVPGSNGDLFLIRASGGQVRIVYSPLDAVQIAYENPDKQVVFFAIGFETTAPANASSILQAKARGINNFSLLVSQVTVPPAMRLILAAPQNRVQGFLAAGHVCSVMGYWQYPSIAQEYQVPIVVTGFEPVDLLQGILLTVKQLENNQKEVQNAYTRAVSFDGNKYAQELINRIFEPCDRSWRGIGLIPMSGLKLRAQYTEYDAVERFQVGYIQTHESEICMAGQILQGLKKPIDCPAFNNQCTPQNPLGATMVSSEGACAAYYRYSRNQL